MSPKLKNSLQIWKLARDLSIRATGDPVAAILQFCDRRIKKFLEDFPKCRTLSTLLDCVASKVGTFFEVPYTDIQLREIQQKYLQKGEKAFVQLEEDFSGDVYGITFKLSNREIWEPEFVSVIDYRGENAARSYYTKWHEIAHLLVLTDQMPLTFRRTHCPTSRKDPEEALVDVIAGNFGFYPSIIRPNINGEITFEAIEDLRNQLCPEASQQSSLIGFVKAWSDPCLLVQSKMALRKREQTKLFQRTFHFQEIPVPTLRAIHVTANDRAREMGMVIYENMRVPERSVIHRVFSEGINYEEAEENLCWWETSNGTILPEYRVRVKAKTSWDSVDGLIIPVN